jgi:hypothetical protein
MKKFLSIKSVRSNIELPAHSLEEYVNNFRNKRNSRSILAANGRSFSNQFENIEVRSAHAPVTGTIEIVFNKKRENNECLHVPVATGFFFTCIKRENGSYKLYWSASMS